MTEPSALNGVPEMIEGLHMVRAILDGEDGDFDLTAGVCLGMALALINILKADARTFLGIEDPEGQTDYVRGVLKEAENSVTVYGFKQELKALDG